MREIKPRVKRAVSSREHQQRMATQAKYTEKQKAVIDTHDLLHSIFWGKPTREELKKVWERMDTQLQANKINLMESEIDELAEEGLVRIPRGEQ